MPSTSRRHFLLSSGAWFGASLLGRAKVPEDPLTLSLIHTTDLHGHILPTTSYGGKPDLGGFARCATQIRAWRRQYPDSLLFDIGDLYQGTPESLASRGALMLRLLNQTGYDAWVPGNHDFDWGSDVAASRFAESKPAIVCANLTEKGSKPESIFPWTMKEAAGIKIGIVGLITPALSTWLAPETLGPFTASDPAPALRKSILEARSAGAQAIVVLAHMGWKKSDDHANPLRSLLEQAPGADVLLAGHTHQDQPSWMLGKTLCSQASYHGLHCGRLDLHFDPAHGKLLSASAETVSMDSSIALDPAVLATAKADIDSARTDLARAIARCTRAIPSKGSPNPLATLLCQAFAHSLAKAGHPVDGVLHGTFGSGGIEPGPITIADCWRLLPYENQIVTAAIHANDLLEIMRESRGSRGPARLLWPFTLHIDQQGTVTRFTFKGEPVPADATYTIAFNSYDSQSGGLSLPILHRTLQSPQAKRRFTAIDTRTALIDYLADRQTIP